MSKEQKIVLITGCSGLIGSKAAKKFYESGYQVVGFDRIRPSDEVIEWLDFYEVDLSSDERVLNALQKVIDKHGKHLSSLIHLAAYYSFSDERTDLYESITVQGTRRLIEGTRLFTQVEQFLFSSTQLIYRPTRVGEKTSENSPLDPRWAYPASKVATERLLSKKRGNVPLVILRIAGCYDERCHSIPISHQIQRIHEKSVLGWFFSGNKNHGAPFVHLDDVVEAIFSSVEKRKSLAPEVGLIIGENRTWSYDALQREISKLLFGREIRTFEVPKWLAKFGARLLSWIPGKPNFIRPWMIDLADDHYELDVTLAKETIDWEPKHDVMKVLPKMIESLQKDPVGWYRENGL